MKSQDYTKTILVNQAPKEVFKAINNVRGWWSEEIEGSTKKLNDEWAYHYEDVHHCKMKIVEFIPNKKVVWLITDNHFSFTKDKNEWKGNKIIFEITEKGKKTQLQFTQVGLVPKYECYDICTNAWGTYIQKSLRNLITKGKGHPNPMTKTQTDFTTSILVTQTPKDVFNAINNVGAWWQGEIKGNTTKLNNEFTYRMGHFHMSKQKMVEFIPNKKVVWLITESELNFAKDKSEWTGTKISFEISRKNSKTQVRFTHLGLVPKFECYKDCSNAWTQLIRISLFNLITTGKGKKVF
jgi:hypothetical protein